MVRGRHLFRAREMEVLVWYRGGIFFVSVKWKCLCGTAARVRYSQYTRILSESSRFSNRLGGLGVLGGVLGKTVKPRTPQYIGWSSVPVAHYL